LEWVDFQVMRATHASIGRRLKLDSKVTADQRGHGVGVAIEEYTKTSLEDRAGCGEEVGRSDFGEIEGGCYTPEAVSLMECSAAQCFWVSVT
jgi:hypothetical protein